MDNRTLEKLEFYQIRQMLSERCRCALGKKLAEKISPSRDINQVRKWLERTDQMVTAVLQSGLPPFGGISDISSQLARLTPGGGPNPEDFAHVGSVLAGSSNVKRWLETISEQSPNIASLSIRIGDFELLINAISTVINDQAEVRDSASSRLASIRRELDTCRNEVRRIAHEYLHRPDIAKCLQSPTVQMHEDRFVLPLKSEYRGRIHGLIHRTSGSGATLFIEPEACVQLNNQIVTLLDKEHDEIARILNELAIKVHAHDEQIRQTVAALSVIDLTAAKAQLSIEHEMCCPEISEDNIVKLRDAKHMLLLEQVKKDKAEGLEVHDVVPIDVRLGDDFRILVITGSNTGGKTVTLKTVGLLAAMTQCGMHIPAAHGAVMPVFKDILLDVGDEQSLQQSLSTFGGHLKRINRILRRCKRGCLVLLDELGSGTDPDEGGAIGQAVLDELLDRHCLAMVSTHLGVLKAYAFSNDHVDNACVEFDVQTLRPTYKLLIGRPGESHAIIIAEKYGLPKRLISRARAHLPKSGAKLRKAIAATEKSRQASEQALRQADDAVRSAKNVQQQYDDKLSSLKQMHSKFSDWLGSLHAMKSGDEIFLRRFKQSARLIRLQLSRQNAIVSLNGKELEIPLQDLMPQMGEEAAAHEITTLRDSIRQNHQQSIRELELTQHARQKAEKQLSAINRRQQYVNQWLSMVAAMQVGSTVDFERKPHTGEILEMDLAAGKVKVKCKTGEMELKVQELFPHTGAFDPAKRKNGHHGPKQKKTKSDRPVTHRNPSSKKARNDAKQVAALAAGDQVYITTFRQNGKIVKINTANNNAVVTAGVFEITVPLTDLSPIKK